MKNWQEMQSNLRDGARLSDQQALSLASCDDTAELARVAAMLRDRGHGNLVTYSR